MSAIQSVLPRCFVLCLLISTPGFGQNAEVGRQIYAENSKSVLVLYAMSPSGEWVAQGSGFWAGDQKIITNAHVANAGKIYLELGPARVPTKVEKIDTFNDLAVLEVNVELVAKPLRFGEKAPAIGETVYAIGNPEGLEKTISQGLVSGLREIDGRELMQITASISHGSSGGPIFNSRGEVVGVAVGAFREGQNLNFAVPISLVKKLLTSADSSSEADALVTLTEVDKVLDRRQSETYSKDESSPWQTDTAELSRLLHRALDEAGTNTETLLRVARAALYQDTDLAIAAAQRAFELKASAETEVALAESLDQKAEWISNDEDQKRSLLTRAEKAARSAVSGSRNPSSKTFYVLANVLEDQGSNSEALHDFQLALDATHKADSDLVPAILRSLTRCSFTLGKLDDSQKWFDQLAATSSINQFDWSIQGNRLRRELKYRESGVAYQTSAEMGGYFDSWCEAATSYRLSADNDNALFAARRCIETGTGESGSDEALGTAHRQISEILNERGVYLEALNHAKEATALAPDQAFAFDDLGIALKGLHRNQEALAAFQQAIRLSDGKYAWMQFEVGSVYVEMENWEFAQEAFEKAAELDPKDAAAAYNVAICNVKRSYFSDAAKWYEEYLRRKPDASDRQEILDRINALRTQSY